MSSLNLQLVGSCRFAFAHHASFIYEMNRMIPLIIQLISGAVGGNIAGAILKNFNLGPIGNSIAGLVGGGIGGQLLTMLISSGTASSAASAVAGAMSSGLDMSSILSSVGGGGIGGAIVMVIVGLIKSQMSKS